MYIEDGGLIPKLNIMENKPSNYVKIIFIKRGLTYQLVHPRQNRSDVSKHEYLRCRHHYVTVIFTT